MIVKIAGRVRGLFAGNYAENREEEQLHLNNRGDQIVAQGLPELTEIVRLGQSYQVITSTAFSSLTAIPTTAAAISLFNGEPATGMCYIIDSIFAVKVLADSGQVDANALWAMNNIANKTAPTSAGLTIRSLAGRAAYGGRAVVGTALSVTNEGWFPHAGSQPPVAGGTVGSPWEVLDVPVRGLYIVPPGGMFNLHTVQVTTQASNWQAGVRWHEAQLLWKP